MIRGFGDFIDKNILNNYIAKKQNELSKEDSNKVAFFSQLLDKVKDPDKSEDLLIFKETVTIFQSTFYEFDLKYLNNYIVKNTLEKFSGICIIFLKDLLDDEEMAKSIFSSLVFISKFFNMIPHCVNYFYILTSIIEIITYKNINYLDLCSEFIVRLFKSETFFIHFCSNNGFSMIYDSIYTNVNFERAQKFFYDLLFNTISADFYKSSNQNSSLLLYYVESMNKDDDNTLPYSESTLFVVHFFSSFFMSNPQFLDVFNNVSGFETLNHTLITHCIDIIPEVYEILLYGTDMNRVVLRFLYQIYTNFTLDLKIRESIIHIIISQNKSAHDIYRKITESTLFTDWILPPSQSNKKIYKKICSFIEELSSKDVVSINTFLEKIIDLSSPPIKGDVPVPSFLNLISDGISRRQITNQELISQGFVEKFLFIPNLNDIAYYFREFSCFPPLLGAIFLDKNFVTLRYAVLEKLLSKDSELINEQPFLKFLSAVVNQTFSLEMIGLYENFMKSTDIFSILTRCISRNPLSFKYFTENIGLRKLNNHVENRPELVNLLLRSLTTFKPHAEVDTWINELPIESNFFKISQEELEKSAITKDLFLHIPSLLYFCRTFNPNSLCNLYLAGKYGLEQYIKRGVPLDRVPYIDKVINRYISPVAKTLILKTPSRFYTYVDQNASHFSVFEFVPNHGPALLSINNYLTSLSFHFRLPYKNKEETHSKEIIQQKLFECSCLKLCIIFDKTIHLLAETKAESLTLPINTQKWNHVMLIFEVKIKWIKYVELVINSDSIKLKTCDEEPLSSVTFGCEECFKTFYISKAIFISEQSFTNEQRSTLTQKGPTSLCPVGDLKSGVITHKDAVFDVPYHAFSTYYRDFTGLEDLFSLFESTVNSDEFSSVFIGLTALQSINKLNISKFWYRLLKSMFKQKEFVSENPMYYLFEHSISNYSPHKAQRIFNIIASDFEFYFVFEPNIVSKWLNRLSSVIDIERWSGFEKTAVNLIRLNNDHRTVNELVDIVSKLMFYNPSEEKLKCFFSSFITMSAFEKSNARKKIVSSFVDLSINNVEAILFSYHQMIDYMGLCDMECAPHFARLIAFYSFKSEKYVCSSKYALHLFSKYYNNEKIWIYSLSILSGELYEDFPASMKIRRPMFCKVIASMFNVLLMNYVLDPKISDLVSKCIYVLSLTIGTEHFASKGCLKYLYLMSNLGIVTNSYDTGSNGESVHVDTEKKVFILKKDDPQKLFSICNLTIDDRIADQYTCDDLNTRYQTFDTNETIVNRMIDVLNSSKVTKFFVNIICSASSMSTLLNDFIIGQAMMNISYRKAFISHLIADLLLKLSEVQNIEMSSFKNIISSLRSCIEHDYISFRFKDIICSLLYILNKLNQMNTQKSIFDDNNVVSDFRVIILSIFLFSNDNFSDLFEVFIKYESIVYHKSIFNENQFMMLWIYQVKHFYSISKNLDLTNALLDKVGKEILSEYKPDEAEKYWNTFETKLFVEEDEDCYKTRTKRTLEILGALHHISLIASKINLCQRIFYDNTLLMHSEELSESISKWLRYSERQHYEFVTRSFRLSQQKKIPEESVRLSPNCLPCHEPRVITPSPFKLPVPDLNVQTPVSFYYVKYPEHKSTIPYVNRNGRLETNPEYYNFYLNGESAFKYSFSLNNDCTKEFYDTFSDYGNIIAQYQTDWYYFVYRIPCVLVCFDKACLLLLLSTIDNGKIRLVLKPNSSIGFLPLTESVAIGDFQNTTLFRGHIVIILPTDYIVMARKYYYMHVQRAISLYSLVTPNVILVFKDEKEMNNFDKHIQKVVSQFLTHLPNRQFLFSISNPQIAQNRWLEREISTKDYLLLVNVFGGRSFTDLSQYPIIPWPCSPTLEPRDLSLPMGQLDPIRAAHYDQTYELSDPKYYYGFHYSIPGCVFWFMYRIPPFCYFSWELNQGWDNPDRMFKSIIVAYESASGKSRSDLKELIPQVLSVPAIYKNISNVYNKEKLCDPVELPEWCNGDVNIFIEKMNEMLDTVEVGPWIDLVFGFKQQGEEAKNAKNIFLPTSYHSSSAEKLNISKSVFEDQVSNFGQCPIQIFLKQHSNRTKIELAPLGQSIDSIRIRKHDMTKVENNKSFRGFIYDKNVYTIPSISVIFSNMCFIIENENEALVTQDIVSQKYVFAVHNSEFSHATSVSVSHDGLFISITYSFGRNDVFYIIYENYFPKEIRLIGSMMYDSTCTSSSVCSTDFVCASIFGEDIIIWGFSNSQLIRIIHLNNVSSIGFCNGVFTAAGEQLVDISVSGEIIREMKLDSSPLSLLTISQPKVFTNKLIVVGDYEGFITLFTINSSFQFELLRKIHVSRFGITSVLDAGKKTETITLAITDQKYNIFICGSGSNHRKCISCSKVTEERCEYCNRPFCTKCKTTKKTCKSCNNIKNDRVEY